jgi:hypothetical protein
MYALEFLLALPLISMGSIIKLRTLPMGNIKRAVYALGLVPFTLFSFFMAAVRFPAYARERSYVLSHRPYGKFWLLKELWQRPVPIRTPLADGTAVN